MINGMGLELAVCAEASGKRSQSEAQPLKIRARLGFTGVRGRRVASKHRGTPEGASVFW